MIAQVKIMCSLCGEIHECEVELPPEQEAELETLGAHGWSTQSDIDLHVHMSGLVCPECTEFMHNPERSSTRPGLH